MSICKLLVSAAARDHPGCIAVPEIVLLFNIYLFIFYCASCVQFNTRVNNEFKPAPLS